MITPEVWTDSLGLGHCSVPISGDFTKANLDKEREEAISLIAQLNIVTDAPIVFERITNHGTVIYGHRLT